MRRNCLFIPLEEIKNQFKENTRQDVKIVAPEILSEQLFNMLTRKGKMLKMEKPLAAEKWTYSKKNRPNFICKSSDFSINSDPGLNQGPFAISFANENAEQDYHYHEKHWEIYFSEHPISAFFKIVDDSDNHSINLKNGGAIIFGPNVVHKMKLSGLTIIIECPSIANDKIAKPQ